MCSIFVEHGHLAIAQGTASSLAKLAKSCGTTALTGEQLNFTLQTLDCSLLHACQPFLEMLIACCCRACSCTIAGNGGPQPGSWCRESGS